MTRNLLPLAVRAARDLRVHHYPVASEIRLDGSGPYPLDVRAVNVPARLGPDGVVLVPRPDGRPYFNPVSACLYALGLHTGGLHTRGLQPGGPEVGGSREARSLGFLAQAHRLRLSQDADGGWRYPVSVPRYRVEPGWYSAMAQGLAVSVLLRACDMTGEQSYGDAAGAAAALLLRPLPAGGCSDYDSAGLPFLEECPADPPNHILNGAIFALIGLSELQGRAGGNDHLRAAQRLAAELSRYDLGYWSRYDLRFGAPATLAYHSLHISLLEIAARLPGGHSFGDTAHRWHGYLRHPGYRLRAAASKARFVLGERDG